MRLLHAIIWSLIPANLVCLMVLGSCAAVKVIDEEGEEVQEYLVACTLFDHYEPDICNQYPEGLTVQGCRLAGKLKICGQLFPVDSVEH